MSNLQQLKKEGIIQYQNYYTTSCFSENLLAIDMTKTEIFMSKPAYFSLSILEVNQVVMYEFQYDYIKLKYEEETMLH